MKNGKLQPPAPNPAAAQQQLQINKSPDYRESYANSVQVRVRVWDCTLIFGTIKEDDWAVENFQAITMSPQQMKALVGVLSQNVQQYEQAFGAIKLTPQEATAAPPPGPPM